MNLEYSITMYKNSTVLIIDEVCKREAIGTVRTILEGHDREINGLAYMKQESCPYRAYIDIFASRDIPGHKITIRSLTLQGLAVLDLSDKRWKIYEIYEPDCPKCGSNMEKGINIGADPITNQDGSYRSWMCPDWPRCTGHREPFDINYPEVLKEVCNRKTEVKVEQENYTSVKTPLHVGKWYIVRKPADPDNSNYCEWLPEMDSYDGLALRCSSVGGGGGLSEASWAYLQHSESHGPFAFDSKWLKGPYTEVEARDKAARERLSNEQSTRPATETNWSKPKSSALSVRWSVEDVTDLKNIWGIPSENKKQEISVSPDNEIKIIQLANLLHDYGPDDSRTVDFIKKHEEDEIFSARKDVLLKVYEMSGISPFFADTAEQLTEKLDQEIDFSDIDEKYDEEIEQIYEDHQSRAREREELNKRLKNELSPSKPSRIRQFLPWAVYGILSLALLYWVLLPVL